MIPTGAASCSNSFCADSMHQHHLPTLVHLIPCRESASWDVKLSLDYKDLQRKIISSIVTSCTSALEIFWLLLDGIMDGSASLIELQEQTHCSPVGMPLLTCRLRSCCTWVICTNCNLWPSLLTEVARHEFASSEECGVMGRTGHGVVLPWFVMI
jgi:hypothetical protein